MYTKTVPTKHILYSIALYIHTKELTYPSFKEVSQLYKYCLYPLLLISTSTLFTSVIIP